MKADARRDVIESARRYADGGWSPIPIPPGSKAPIIDGWQNLRISREQVGEFFKPGDNVGVLLGEPSGLLIDVDLDHSLVVELADGFLPETECVFGRASKPRSHWLYRVPRDPGTHKRQVKDHGMLVELRSTGCQTVFPGSIHPSGELIEWQPDGEPTSIDADRLKAAVDALADEVCRRLGIDPKPPAVASQSRCRLEPSDNRMARALAYTAKRDLAVNGQGGSADTFAVACDCFRFGLDMDEALAVLIQYSARCEPPWTEKELRHKLGDALARVIKDHEFGKMLEDRASARTLTANDFRPSRKWTVNE